jgi:hypothetical protein
MSLVSQIASLAARIADEFNAVRSEISALPAGTFETGTSFPASPSVGQTFFMTDEKVAYIYSGESWLPMTFAGVFDGLTSQAQETFVLLDGNSATPSAPTEFVDGGDA